MDPTAERRRGGQRGWAYLIGVVAVLGAIGCGLMWAVSSPVEGSPDEDYHLTSIWCAGGYDHATCRHARPAPTGERQVRVPGLVGTTLPCFAFKPAQPASCQASYLRWVVTPRVDNGNYPPEFYWVMHRFVGPSVEQSVLLMRAFNVLLTVALMTVLYLAAAPENRRLLVYVLATFAVPLGWYLVASINPSGWAITGVAASGFALHSLLDGTPVRRLPTIMVLAVALFMAVGSRGDAAVYVVVVAFAVTLFHLRRLWNSRAHRRLLMIPTLVALTGIIVLARSQQVASVAGSSQVVPRSARDEVLFLLRDFPTLVSGMFGATLGLGWVDVGVPALTSVSVIMIVGFLLITGGRHASWTKLAAMAVIVVAMIGFPVWSLYRQRIDIGTLQPRYLLPLMPVLLVFALARDGRRSGFRFSRGQSVVVYVMLVAAQAAVVVVNTERYVDGLGVTSTPSVRWWWPGLPPPFLVCTAGSIGFALFGLMLVRISGQVDLPAEWVASETTADTPRPGQRPPAPKREVLTRARRVYDRCTTTLSR